MTPREPQVEGWTENLEAAAEVTEEIRKQVSLEEPNARVWDKGSVRVVSSYVSVPGNASAWVVTISKNFRRPNDEIVASVCRDFGMRRTTEIPQAGKTQRGFMEYDDVANGFI